MALNTSSAALVRATHVDVEVEEDPNERDIPVPATPVVQNQTNSSKGKGPSNRFELLTELETNSKNLPLLGYLTMWSLRGIAVPHDTFKNLLEQAGFSQDVPTKPKPKKALKRAILRWLEDRSRSGKGPTVGGKPYELELDDDLPVSSLTFTGTEDDEDEEENASGSGSGSTGKNKGKSKTNQNQKSLLRPIRSKKFPHLRIFGVVIELIDLDDISLSYGTQLRVVLNTKTDTISVSQSSSGNLSEQGTLEDDFDLDIDAASNAHLNAIAAEIQKFYQYYRETLLSIDLAATLRDIIFGLGAFGVRQLGGIYFIPVSQRKELEDVRQLIIAELPKASNRGNHTEFTVLPQPDLASSKGQFAKAAYEECLSQTKEMEKALGELLAKAATGKVRQSTINNRLAQYKELMKRTEIYHDVLGLQQQEILWSVNQMQQKAQELLMGAIASQAPSQAKTSARQPRKAKPIKAKITSEMASFWD